MTNEISQLGRLDAGEAAATYEDLQDVLKSLNSIVRDMRGHLIESYPGDDGFAESETTIGGKHYRLTFEWKK
jgi:hypothetical protein